ncbi:hypothetical protein [Heyndrickxia sporothermodurans]|uniref:hypothetical protein n=1 Tax=Heyndrickxia sporothermodurans TaxID=46224 RepID=UPI000D395900|nr:hypothetical protein [Heyndrickxia sporothermodurans]PTY92935.1 hypothetical protein B5V90_02320 [Heyndrickxia sporothermodurans]
MKKGLKIIGIIVALIIVIGIIASLGSGSETEQVEGNVNKQDQSAEQKSADKKEAAKEDNNTDVNKVIADDENVKATLLRVERKKDDVFGDTIDVVFEIQNKTDRNLEFQARSVSVDGKMVDETILSMSQEISPGKTADARLTMTEFEGYELPALEKDLELELHGFDWDNMEFELNYPVSITF